MSHDDQAADEVGTELPVQERIRAVPGMFVERHVVSVEQLAGFHDTIASAIRLRNSVLAESPMLIFVYAVGNDIVRLHTNAERDGIDFSPPDTREDFTLPWERPFDREWMRALSEHGHRATPEGRVWTTSHPALAPRVPG